jgi:hypothetical protein
MTRTLAFAALLGLIFATGCGRGTTSVRGKVTYLGKPLVEGAVVFMAEDNNTYPADIGPDGSYYAPAVPRGKCRVVVQSSHPRPAARPQPRINAKDSFGKSEASKDDAKAASRLPPAPEPSVGNTPPLIPNSYINPETSGLVVELTEPEQTFPIELK